MYSAYRLSPASAGYDKHTQQQAAEMCAETATTSQAAPGFSFGLDDGMHDTPMENLEAVRSELGADQAKTDGADDMVHAIRDFMYMG